MIGMATHTVDVLGGVTAEDEYGDSTDGATVLAAAVPASIMEKTKTVGRLDGQTPRTVRVVVGRVPAGTPVVQGCRLRDTADSSRVWLVDAVAAQANPVMSMGVVLDLRRV